MLNVERVVLDWCQDEDDLESSNARARSVARQKPSRSCRNRRRKKTRPRYEFQKQNANRCCRWGQVHPICSRSDRVPDRVARGERKTTTMRVTPPPSGAFSKLNQLPRERRAPFTSSFTPAIPLRRARGRGQPASRRSSPPHFVFARRWNFRDA